MTTREVLFNAYDEVWARDLPVTLLTYENGTQDLHRQTGSNFDEAVDHARVLLAQRGLQVAEPTFIGPTGAYMSVTAKTTEPLPA